ncbi:MAG: hypothetical protein CVU41_15490 [Chloroflexi bacterium HGW-Chloroflexi-3]|nr:MAG: hypothetical protein CVU41_15490 [Chloroflexi bacterium HGW-Chloroflexi-3]
MTTEEILNQFKTIINGVCSDIFKAYEVYNILIVIWKNATEINEKKYGIFFGKLQEILVEQLILLLTKIFEDPGQYQIKSIPFVIKYIKDHEQLLPPKLEKDEVVDKLLGKLRCQHLKEKESFVVMFFKHWANQLGEIKTQKEKIILFRNKIVAHHERLDEQLVEGIYPNEILELLEKAKIFVSFIDNVYLDQITVDIEGNNFIYSDSKAAAVILKNLLVKANVIDISAGRKLMSSLEE